MENLVFTRDEKGRPVATAKPPRDVLAHYLEGELRANARACRHILEKVRQVRSGQRPEWEGLSNDWRVLLRRDTAEISIEDTVPERIIRLTTEELEQAVEAWLRFIEPPAAP